MRRLSLMNERQYPIHLRRIGEPEIADYLESMVIEIDTHEKMFLELCELRRQKEALEEIVRGRCNLIEDPNVSKDFARVALTLVESYMNAHRDECINVDYDVIEGYSIYFRSDCNSTTLEEMTIDGID
jgi:hypothetical protein